MFNPFSKFKRKKKRAVHCEICNEIFSPELMADHFNEKHSDLNK